MHGKCSTLLVSFSLFLLGLGVLQLTPRPVSAAATVNWPTAVNVSSMGRGYWPVMISGNDFGTGQIYWSYTSSFPIYTCTTVSGCAATGPCTVKCYQPETCDVGYSSPATIYLFGLSGGMQSSPAPIYRCLAPIITGISRIRFPLTGGTVTITGRYLKNVDDDILCRDSGSTQDYWATRFGGTTGTWNLATSCTPTEIVSVLPTWGNTGSGWDNLYLCAFPPAGGVGSCSSAKIVSGIEYTIPVLSSVHRSTIPMSGEVVTITGQFFGTNKNFYTGVGITTVSATVYPSSTNWISTSDTQLVIRFPHSCSVGAGVQGVYLSWGGGQSTILNNVIQYTLPTFSSCTSNPISWQHGGELTLAGSNLGTDCSFWERVTSGGINSATIFTCSNTHVTFDVPPGGSGTNVDATVKYCSTQNAVCSDCVTFSWI